MTTWMNVFRFLFGFAGGVAILVGALMLLIWTFEKWDK